jgi:exodeoxyribonuclease V alpha subunit
VDTDPTFAAFVAAGLWPGLGRTLAEKLPAAGVSSPETVTVGRLTAIPSVSPARAQRLVAAFTGASDAYAVVAMLVPAGVPARAARGVLEALDRPAADQLRADPWRLLDVPEVRLADADRLAISLLRDQADRSDLRRGRAIVAHVLTRAARDGHTTMPTATLRAAVAGEGIEDPTAAIAAAVEDGRVRAFPGTGTAAADDETLGLARYAAAEQAIAAGVNLLLRSAEPWPAEGAATAVEGLDDAQRAAAVAVATAGVSLLIGGPGTGKSRTVATVVELARERGLAVALAAPTGRAAKRLEELADAPAQTLHRLLGAQGTSGDFARGADWPLDEDVIVVDETSMLDVELAASLLDACSAGTHLLLVGDPAQLPSIGAGRVLGDLVDSGVVPVTELRTLYRQAEGGAIARLATAVRGGELPPVDAPDREVVVVPAADSATAARRAVQLVTDSIPRALGIAPDEIQVITPVHRGPAGTVALNVVLKAALNPGEGEGGGFDPGDRVVATANHLDDGFANGEVGVVTAISDASLVVGFPGGPVTVPPRALSDLRHGWAITVHRAQGSEWPAVVAVLPPESGGLLSRPLVYTALTRARRHLSIVHAAGPALARAVREVGARPRRTRLTELLRATVESGEREREREPADREN